MSLSSKKRSEIYKILVKFGHSKEDASRILKTSSEYQLDTILGNVSSGLPYDFGLVLRPVSDFVPVPVPVSSVGSLAPSPVIPKVRVTVEAKPESVLYSFKVPVADLDALKAVSMVDGESVAFHIRQSIRAYLLSRR